MFNVNAVSAKLALTSTDDGNTYFVCNEAVVLESGGKVHVTGISVHEHDEWCDVNVTLAEEHIVYADNVFAKAVGDLLNMQVSFTERGMQDYGWVSMET